jgi:hypothetical protein
MPGVTAYQVAEEHLLPGAQAANIRAPRFFVQMGFSEIRVDTDAIQFKDANGQTVYRVLPRARIVPCVTYAHRTNINEIREGEKIEGSEELDRDGRVVYARYYRYAWYEAERLLDIENGSNRKSGLVEVTALQGLASVVYGRDGSINHLFYPQGLDALPETNAGLMEHLKSRVAEIRARRPVEIDELHYSTVLAVGEQLIAAVKRADEIQRARIDFTHNCMSLKPNDELFKAEYDPVDLEMLLRTGRPRIRQAEVMTAEALNKLAEREKQKTNGNGTDEVAQLRAEIARIAARNDALADALAKRDAQFEALLNHLIASPAARNAVSPSILSTPAAPAPAAAAKEEDDLEALIDKLTAPGPSVKKPAR